MKEIDLLKKILEEKDNREKLIKEFQSYVWDAKITKPLLGELAYDLDFYEPNEKIRKESPNYYGDEHLEKEILDVLKKLQNYRKS